MARYCEHCYTPVSETDTVCKFCGEHLRKRESSVPVTEAIVGMNTYGEDTYVPVDDIPEPIVSDSKDMEQAPVVKMSEWIWSTFLTFIPIVNLVVLIIWGFGADTNPNKKNFSRAMLIWTIIGLITSIVLVASAFALIYFLLGNGLYGPIVRYSF